LLATRHSPLATRYLPVRAVHAAITHMEITPIGYINSPYKQKFAIPRQPGLVPEATGEIIFSEDFSDPNCLREIEQFSHLWLIFQFHETVDKGWTPTVQPPRLGGKEKVGVFASRSTFRPNGLGLSVVTNLGWEQQGSTLVLKVGGIDLLDKTPVIDIKPYLPYADTVPDASSGYAEEKPGHDHDIVFSPEAEAALLKLEKENPDLRAFITSVLKQDPRPAWRKKPEDAKSYGMALMDINIKWCIYNNQVKVLRLEKIIS